MMNVFIAAGCPIGTVTLYRSVHLQEQFAFNQIQATVYTWQDDSPALLDAAAQADLIILQRVEMSASVRRLIDTAHAQGKRVIFDADDLIFEPDLAQWNRTIRQFSPDNLRLYHEGVQRYLATLQASDYVFTASRLLAELAQRRNKHAFVHRNAIGREMQALGDRFFAARKARIAQPKVVIGYGSGTATHNVDFEQIAPALLDVMSRHTQVELWLAGPLQTPALLEIFAERIRRFPLTDLAGWFELASQFDINLAPLEVGNIFCRAKSEIKVVEAGLLGIPTIATRIDPFEDAIQPGQNGLLAGNLAEWIDALDQLVSQPALRTALGQAARATASEHYSLPVRAAQLATLLQAITADDPTAALANMTVTAGFTPLVIHWLIDLSLSGFDAHLLIFRLIRYLVEFGHECHLYIWPAEDAPLTSVVQMQQLIEQQFLKTGATFHRWTGQADAADVTIATSGPTATALLTLPQPGRGYYLVQDIESATPTAGVASSQASGIDRSNLHGLALGSWLARLLRQRYQATVDAFDFAVDLEIYHAPSTAKSIRPRLAFYANQALAPQEYALGVAALQIVKARQPDVELVFFGCDHLDPTPPFAHVFVGPLNAYHRATMYADCTVGLVLALTNLPPVFLEMMACQCAVVAIESEAIGNLLTHRVNALLAAPTPTAIAEAILLLLADQPLRQSIAKQANQQAMQKPWRASARQIEQVLLQHAPPTEQRCVIQRQTNGTSSSLIWQIYQLIDQAQVQHKLAAQTEATLQRIIIEKAHLVKQQQTRESSAGPVGLTLPTRAPLQLPRTQLPLWPSTQAKLADWTFAQHKLRQLQLSTDMIWQTFRAERNHLCRIDLFFAYAASGQGEAVRFTLYNELVSDPPLVDLTIPRQEIQANGIFSIRFSAQPRSFGTRYKMGLALAQAGDSVALWCFQTALQPDASLQQGESSIPGQLAFQVFYQEGAQLLASGVDLHQVKQGMHSRSMLLRRRGNAARHETQRLLQKIQHTLRSGGIRTLLNEIKNYLAWHLNKPR